MPEPLLTSPKWGQLFTVTSGPNPRNFPTVDTEVKSILGRADVVIKTKNDIFVLELKVDNSIDDALPQIEDKGYTIPYSTDGRKITKCGITMSSEGRNITNWRAVDDEGNVEHLF